MLSEADVRALYAQGEEATVTIVLELEEQVTQLARRVGELEARLNKTSWSSHKPPSSDGYRKAPSPTRREQQKRGRRTGGQPGHKGKTLKMVAEPDAMEMLQPEACGCYGKKLKDKGQVVARGQVFELQPLQLQVTEYQVLELTCSGCGMRSRGEMPTGVVPGAQYGSRMKRLMVYLQTQQLLPQKRTSQLLDDLLNAPVSEGALGGVMVSCAERLKPVLGQIKQGILDSGVAHFDETGLKTAGKLHWLPTSSTEALTLYVVDLKRDQKALDRIGILSLYRGTAVHDDYQSYSGYGCDHAGCNAQHLRDLDAIYEQTGQQWSRDLRDLLRQAQHWKKNGRLTEFRQKQFIKRYDELLQPDGGTIPMTSERRWRPAAPSVSSNARRPRTCCCRWPSTATVITLDTEDQARSA